MSKVTTKVMYPLKNSSELRMIAEVVSKYYGLDVLIDEADFNPYEGRVDMKILTPSGKIIVVFHMSFYKDANHWAFGGQTFVTGDHIKKLSKKVRGSLEAI